jgi:hypothetical protein
MTRKNTNGRTNIQWIRAGMGRNFLEQIRTIVPVPASPIDVDEPVLRKNEAALNTRFPEDFVAYARVYGSGSVVAGPYSWEIWSPFRTAYPRIVENFAWIWGEVRDALETHEVPLGLFPEPGGLLPFGVRSDVWFTWRTRGQPDDWNVVVMWSYEDDSFEVFEMGFAEFLFRLVTKRIDVAGFQSPWDEKEISFEPKVYYNV